MKHYQYKTRGTCSAYIDFDLDDNGVISDVQFTGGCNGNLQGIGRLVKGRAAAEVIDLLKGTDCDGRGTSCPDQLAKALEAALQK
jgi:uncharacterized protein (TIGR03905 family)